MNEEIAEVIFVCEDAPSEPKWFARLDGPPVEAAEEWRGMAEDQIRGRFQGSEPA